MTHRYIRDWTGDDPLKLPLRESKPRAAGLTSIQDVRLTCQALEAMLTDYGDFLDFAKLGVGAAYVTPRLLDKLELYRNSRIEVYLGGTLFEKFLAQDRLADYKRFLVSANITTVEVSDGVVTTPIDERLAIIEDFRQDFVVISEVGSKDPGQIMAPSEWIAEIEALLDAGCSLVVTEGRESANAGLYRPSGEIRTGLVTDIIGSVDVNRIMFEAPTGISQMFFINTVGPDVNLGNVSPHDLLLLEAQRCGLRCETFELPI